MSFRSYEFSEVEKFLRKWPWLDDQPGQYDAVGTIQLFLAVLDNLTQNCHEDELKSFFEVLEASERCLTPKQRQFLLEFINLDTPDVVSQPVVDRFESYLARTGRRFTREQRLILELIVNLKRPFDQEQLIACLGDGDRLSRSTVYRVVDDLLRADLITHFSGSQELFVLTPPDG